LKVKNRSGRLLTELELPDDATVDDLQKQFHKIFHRFYPERQRFTKENLKDPLVPGKTLVSFDLKSGDTIVFKDLGMQLTMKQLYIIEYFGPLLLYVVTYLRPPFFYSEKRDMTYEQNLALLCWSFHFIKRILESAFVHVFSSEYIGISFLVKNASYYWGFGLFIGYFINHPLFTPVHNPLIFYAGLVIFFVSELANGWIHWTLSTLRPEGSKEKKIPTGFLYNITAVSFPNYFFESLAWLGWNMMFFSVAGGLFFIAGTGQMLQWALKKHRRYVTEFDGKEGRPKYPKRKSMIPFII